MAFVGKNGQKVFRLLTGAEMPQVGLGTWRSDKGKVKEAVVAAIGAGYRHLDCAYCYGNEDEVGEGLAEALEKFNLKREDVFVTSKLWNQFHNPARVREGINRTLKSLRLDYVDLYLVHWPQSWELKDDPFAMDANGKPFHDPFPYKDTWAEMEKLHKEGLAKAIGVSNLSVEELKEVVGYGGVVPAVNQVERNPLLVQEPLKKYCDELGIVVTAYSPLGNPSIRQKDPQLVQLLEHPAVKKIGEKYGKGAGQVLIRFAVQGGFVTIPKSVTPSRIVSNFAVFDFELTDEEYAELAALNADKHYVNPGWRTWDKSQMATCT